MSNDINYNRIYSNLASFTSLPIHMKGRRYVGQCYYSGQRHSSRNDKLTCYMKGGKIWLCEQGEQPKDLWAWMLDFGGYKSDLEVGDALRKESGCILDIPEFIEPETRYVYKSSMNRTLHKYTDNLFIWLSSIFGKQKVKAAYDLYQVGSDGEKTIFWMINESGQVAHDKIMLFDKATGKRQGYPNRRFKSDFGFNSTPAFGDVLLDKFSGQKIYCVESEKTALLFYLYSKKLCVATSGASCLRKAKLTHTLLGDYDNAGERWLEAGGIRWWEYYPSYNVQDGDDIGDYIVEKFGNKK